MQFSLHVANFEEASSAEHLLLELGKSMRSSLSGCS